MNKYLKAIRGRIAQLCENESPFSGQVEVDESYFGARRAKGKRGRGARGKTIVFGIFKRNGNVYTEIVPGASKKSLQRVIRGKDSPKIASFTLMDGEAITGWWIWDMPSIFESITAAMNLSPRPVT